ncbi:MAG: IreB family regulatory phosphoprotein [Tenericutes bacterium]|nr:IreB family regulatory phosphoprotein [Mycoplasmatota bacterium]
MTNDETRVVETQIIKDSNTKRSLIKICEDLQERGYNPTKQIVAYLVSGDPGYISSYKECRNRMLEFKREDILELMLESYIS